MTPRYFFADTNAIDWRASSIAEGVEVKDLGSANGQSMQLVRFAPGTRFPAHFHDGPEFVYLMEGEAFQDGQQLLPGWASAAEAGTYDSDFHSPTGCVFLTLYTD